MQFIPSRIVWKSEQVDSQLGRPRQVCEYGLPEESINLCRNPSPLLLFCQFKLFDPFSNSLWIHKIPFAF